MKCKPISFPFLMEDRMRLVPKWSAGDIMYRDLNEDGKISKSAGTLDDHGDLKVIGNSTPRYFFGIDFEC